MNSSFLERPGYGSESRQSKVADPIRSKAKVLPTWKIRTHLIFPTTIRRWWEMSPGYATMRNLTKVSWNDLTKFSWNDLTNTQFKWERITDLILFNSKLSGAQADRLSQASLCSNNCWDGDLAFFVLPSERRFKRLATLYITSLMHRIVSPRCSDMQSYTSKLFRRSYQKTCK